MTWFTLALFAHILGALTLRSRQLAALAAQADVR